MKRIVLSALFLSMFALSCQTEKATADAAPLQNKRQGWNGATLYGDVESVVVKSREDGNDSYTTRKYMFNQRGDVYEVSTYNASGRLIPETIYRYDENGKMVEKQLHYEGALCKRVLFRYDAEGNNTEVNELDAHGKLLRKLNYIYVEGRIVKMIADIRINNSRCEFPFAYDSRGNLIEGTEYATPLDDEFQSGFISHEYAYDLNGNVTKDEFEWDDNVEGAAVDVAYVYDDKGRKIKEKTIVDTGEPFWTVQIFKYDEADRVIEVETFYSSNNELTKYTKFYKYDSVGNEIEVVEFGRNGAKSEVVRNSQITYRRV